MVLGDQHHVLRAGVMNRLHPLVRVELCWIEYARTDRAVAPFTIKKRVCGEVQDDAEFQVLPRNLVGRGPKVASRILTDSRHCNGHHCVSKGNPALSGFLPVVPSDIPLSTESFSFTPLARHPQGLPKLRERQAGPKQAVPLQSSPKHFPRRSATGSVALTSNRNALTSHSETANDPSSPIPQPSSASLAPEKQNQARYVAALRAESHAHDCNLLRADRDWKMRPPHRFR